MLLFVNTFTSFLSKCKRSEPGSVLVGMIYVSLLSPRASLLVRAIAYHNYLQRRLSFQWHNQRRVRRPLCEYLCIIKAFVRRRDAKPFIHSS